MDKTTFFVDCFDARTHNIKKMLLNRGENAFDLAKHFKSENCIYILSPKTKILDISDINPSSRVFGFTPQIPNDKGITFFNVTDDEVFACKNAVLTAESILGIVLERVPFGFTNANTLILGYGRCGKAITNLFNMHCKTTVFATTKQEENLLTLLGIDYISKLDRGISAFNIIINTIPSKILTADKIDFLSRGCYIFDIASQPGGIDFDYAHGKEFFAEQFLALPAKYRLDSATQALYDCIFKNLE